MPKNIPIALQAHQAQHATTLTYLMRIGPLPNGDFIRITSLDRAVVYEDIPESGPHIFHPSMQLSALSVSNDLAVDNAETMTLAPVYPVTGVTVAMVDNGDLDTCEVTCLKVNYLDLTMGHELVFNGPIGEVRVVRGDLITFENRSWSQLLKQNSVCELDSLTCRVKHFGSQPGDEMFPCHYDAGPEWEAFTVSAVGSDAHREFFIATTGHPLDHFNPGLVQWQTGDNAGMSREVEAHGPTGSGDAVTLQFSARHPIEVGDTGEIRRDCSRNWAGHNSCQTYNNRQWFRGEPFIPVSDTIALSTPGAGSGGNSPGFTSAQ